MAVGFKPVIRSLITEKRNCKTSDQTLFPKHLNDAKTPSAKKVKYNLSETPIGS